MKTDQKTLEKAMLFAQRYGRRDQIKATFTHRPDCELLKASDSMLLNGFTCSCSGKK